MTTEEPQTFGCSGRHPQQCTTELLDLERSEGRAEPFAARRRAGRRRRDGALRRPSTSSNRSAGASRRPSRSPAWQPEAQETLASQFSLEAQHAKGSWFVPEKVSLKTGLANLAVDASPTTPATPRASSGRTRRACSLCRVPTPYLLGRVPAAVRAALRPLRAAWPTLGHQERRGPAGDLGRRWTRSSAPSASRSDDELAVMRYGAGWGSLRAPEQLAAKQRLLDALASQASIDLGARYRAYRLAPLIDRYYSKAKGGVARRKSVLTKPLEKTLSGFFGGDWLALLALHRRSAPPQTRRSPPPSPPPSSSSVGTKDASAVAADLGLPADEVQRALATFWATTEDSPPTAISPGRRARR